MLCLFTVDELPMTNARCMSLQEATLEATDIKKKSYEALDLSDICCISITQRILKNLDIRLKMVMD